MRDLANNYVEIQEPHRAAPPQMMHKIYEYNRTVIHTKVRLD